MPLEILESALESRTVRKAIGTRVISSLQTSEKKDDNGNFLGWVLDFGKNALGFLWSKITALVSRVFNVAALWGAIVGAARFILTFNFNITDAQLDLQVKAAQQAVYAQLGGTIGSALGYLVCGVAPAMALFTVNEALGALVLKNVGEEFLDELAGNIGALVQTTFRATAHKLFASAYKNTRRWLKKPNNLMAQIMFGDRYAEVMQKWGAPGSKPFVISEQIEEAIESIPNENLRVLVEEALEEFTDACIEAGYIVANTIDGFMAAQKLQRQTLLGERRIIEVQPNRETNEKFLLAGPEEVLKPVLIQTLTQHQLLADRDVGQIVGSAGNENLKPRPYAQKLKLQLFSVPKPPYMARENGNVQRVTIDVSDVPRSKMDWEKIKAALGGENGYLWGRFLASGTLENGRPLMVYGATKDEAEDRFLAIAALSEAKVYYYNVTEEVRTGTRLTNDGLQKESTRVYPAYVTIEVNRVQLDGGRTAADGKKRQRFSKRFDLWRSTKPADWEESIAELFKGDTDAN